MVKNLIRVFDGTIVITQLDYTNVATQIVHSTDTDLKKIITQQGIIESKQFKETFMVKFASNENVEEQIRLLHTGWKKPTVEHVLELAKQIIACNIPEIKDRAITIHTGLDHNDFKLKHIQLDDSFPDTFELVLWVNKNTPQLKNQIGVWSDNYSMYVKKM